MTVLVMQVSIEDTDTKEEVLSPIHPAPRRDSNVEDGEAADDGTTASSTHRDSDGSHHHHSHHHHAPEQQPGHRQDYARGQETFVGRSRGPPGSQVILMDRRNGAASFDDRGKTRSLAGQRDGSIAIVVLLCMMMYNDDIMMNNDRWTQQSTTIE